MKSVTGQAMGSQLTTVALVGFKKEDESSIQAIFDDSASPIVPDRKWKFHSLGAALNELQQDSVPVVMCDHDRMPAAWKLLLQQFALLAKPPLLIVASRLADERLWAEALNLGAYDVLARPFDRTELIRSISSAWLHWRHQYTECAFAARSVA